MNWKGMTEKERLSIESMGSVIKENKYLEGELQFSDITNRDFFVKAYSDEVKYCIFLE